MKNIIVPLIGEEKSGKTKTLRRFFGLALNDQKQIAKKIIENTLIICYSFGSPQELIGDFCNHEKVIKNIKKRLKYCKIHCENEGCQNFILLLPMTIMRNKEKLNEKCITKPISWLKSEKYKVYSIYLQKLSNDIEKLMKDICREKIESLEEYDRQASKLKNMISNI